MVVLFLRSYNYFTATAVKILFKHYVQTIKVHWYRITGYFRW